jgi:hypothetical protein
MAITAFKIENFESHVSQMRLNAHNSSFEVYRRAHHCPQSPALAEMIEPISGLTPLKSPFLSA